MTTILAFTAFVVVYGLALYHAFTTTHKTVD
jgi:hypothetical protein